MQSKLQIQENAQPKFCKARTVPFAIKEPIEQELDHLEASGIIEKAKLQIQENAQPKFCKARMVPFSIKEPIEQELDRLEASGIIEKVTHSEWAAPIVVVPKKDGKIRICCDYEVTVNQALDVEQYPLPKPDNLFASLAGGKKFTN